MNWPRDRGFTNMLNVKHVSLVDYEHKDENIY
jgi:hypothetical protein